MAPLFFLLLYGLIILCIAIANQVQLTNSVRDASRAAAVCGGVARNQRNPVPTLPDGRTPCSSANLQSWINSTLQAIPGGVTPVITVSANNVQSANLDACDYGGTVDIRVTFKQPLYFPFLDGFIGDGANTGTRTLTADSQSVCEQ